MKDYNSIEGWFSPQDCEGYKFLLNECPDDGTFVEVGSWLGKSSSFLIDNKKPSQKIICIDTWKGSQNELHTHHRLATLVDIFEIFKENLGDRDYSSIRLPSVEAAKTFDNDSLDVVFIDAEHTYEALKNDINAWLPKVKQGGYIAGHDYSSGWPGVVRAVHEFFSSNSILQGSYGSCWMVKKI